LGKEIKGRRSTWAIRARGSKNSSVLGLRRMLKAYNLCWLVIHVSSNAAGKRLFLYWNMN
jgi:hypothetical protein